MPLSVCGWMPNASVLVPSGLQRTSPDSLRRTRPYLRPEFAGGGGAKESLRTNPAYSSAAHGATLPCAEAPCYRRLVSVGPRDRAPLDVGTPGEGTVVHVRGDARLDAIVDFVDFAARALALT